jgi:hypothetical protein
VKITSGGLVFIGGKLFAFNKSRLPWAALVVLIGWADVALTLIGQPAAYWGNHAAITESDFAGAALLQISPWVFLLAIGVFHIFEGWLVLVMPKWISRAVAAYCITCGIIAVFLWSCMLGLTNVWLYASTGAYLALAGLMAIGAAIGIIRFIRK